MSTTIESLELEIVSNSKDAVSGIEALTQSLKQLKSASNVKLGLSAVIDEMAMFNKADITGVKSKADSIREAISSLTNLPKSNLSGYITPLKNLPKAFEGLESIDMGNLNSHLKELVQSLAPLSDLSKSNLSSYITSLKKLPEVLEELNKIDMGAFASKIQEVATAMKPLADEMEKISNGFTAMPTKIQKLIQSNDSLTKSNKKSTVSFTDFYHKLKLGLSAIKQFTSSVYSAVKKSMDYTENMNLFEVSMGEFASEAMKYAEEVRDAMGIDPSEWIRSQGIFMTMATGFGIAGERAATMSKNLTQLGYDLASFYNMDTETAMLKLKSGLAGELEPLRAIGYDLSQAKLEATTLELGITKSVSAMTQAEKAQLRYYAIMTQVTVAQGDMARTLNDPANQMRVFKSEVNMAAREIGNMFIPALTTLLPYATAVAKVIGSLASSLAGLFGFTPESVTEATGSVVENTDAMTENLEDAQEEAKKLKSHLLGIDELNVISPQSGSVDDTSGWNDFELPDYSKTFMDGLVENQVNQIVAEMKEWLGITEEITSWADLFDTRLGKILITVGAIGFAFTLWKLGTGAMLLVEQLPTLTQLVTGLKMALKGFAVGAIIAAAIAGAAYLISITDDTMTKIGAIVSAGVLALGAVLAFTGNIPLGVALMATGALAIGSAIAMNTSALSDEVKNVIGLITGIVSGALLAIGAILAFTGANIPLGIALMVGGALTFATTVAPNWSALSDGVKGVLSAIMAIVGGALVALGIILLCTGGGMPLGIGLILAGAASLAAPVALNWNFLLDTFKGIWDGVTSWWNSNIAPIFTKEWWANLIGKAMQGLRDGIKNGINWVIEKFNWLISKINSVLGKSITLPDWLGGGSFSLGLQIPLIPTFAEGGFPEQGQMFIAREAGAEMVGNIGRKTAVANNDQIIAGIAGGVAEANEEQNALLREQNSLLRSILEKDNGVILDGKKLATSVEKYQRERGRVVITGGVL